MPRIPLSVAAVLSLLCLWLIAGCGSGIAISEGESLKGIKLPKGFSIAVFASNVPGARSMSRGQKGTIFVGTDDRDGKVYAITDQNGDYKADSVKIIGQNLFCPNGVEFRDGSLYVAEINRILRFDNIEELLQKPPKPIVVNDKFPDRSHHGPKYIRFGPDGWLYVPVGAPCNVCECPDPRFGTIMRIKKDSSNPEIFARGVRNSVGLDWHPVSKELWFTDNGRDHLGDDKPPDELNKAPKAGLHFGFPYCHGGFISDPEFGHKHKCSEFTAPELKLPAHVAPLGMHFYDGAMFPEKYRQGIFICEHGSWNRSSPIGYRISFVTLKEGKVAGYETFASGWLKDFQVSGRPVDSLILPDGSMLVSDDQAGKIYRISYKAPMDH